MKRLFLVDDSSPQGRKKINDLKKGSGKVSLEVKKNDIQNIEDQLLADEISKSMKSGLADTEEVRGFLQTNGSKVHKKLL